MMIFPMTLYIFPIITSFGLLGPIFDTKYIINPMY